MLLFFLRLKRIKELLELWLQTLFVLIMQIYSDLTVLRSNKRFSLAKQTWYISKTTKICLQRN